MVLAHPCINILWYLSQVEAKGNSSCKTIKLLQLLKLWWIIFDGYMASMMDKAKQFVSNAAASMEKPKADVTDVDLKGVGLGCVTYLAKINVTNPYSVSIPIGEIRYLLKCAGSEIASGTVPDPGSLKKDSDTMLEVDMKVPHNVLISLVKDVAADWDIDYDLTVKLIVDLPLIGNITIPVNRTGQVKLPSLKDCFA